MKSLKYSVVIWMTVVALTSSCTDEDKVKIPDFESGALPFFQKDPSTLSFVDFFNFEQTQIRFYVDFKDTTKGPDQQMDKDLEFSRVESIDITLAYMNINLRGLPEENIVTITSSQNWPMTVELTDEDLLDLLPDEVFTADSLHIGDAFRFTCDINLVDGRRFPGYVRDVNGLTPGFSPSLQANLNSTFVNYNVSCSSDLADGTTYDVTTEIETTCCGLPTGTFTGTTATVTALGEGNYLISDFMADYLTNAGINGDEPIVVTDFCNTITVNATNCPAASALCYAPNGNGTYDPQTGVWTLKWVDALGNNISGTTTLSPQ